MLNLKWAGLETRMAGRWRNKNRNPMLRLPLPKEDNPGRRLFYRLVSSSKDKPSSRNVKSSGRDHTEGGPASTAEPATSWIPPHPLRHHRRRLPRAAF